MMAAKRGLRWWRQRVASRVRVARRGGGGPALDAADAGVRPGDGRGEPFSFAVSVRSLPKHEADPSPIEDAWASHVERTGAGALLRCAIADGASTSYLGGLWARMLVEELARLPDRSSAPQSHGYPPTVDEWERISPVHDLLERLPDASLSAPPAIRIPIHPPAGAALSPDRFDQAVRWVRAYWPPLMAAYEAHREAVGRPLRFYEDEAFAAGAAATVAVLSLTAGPGDRRGGEWSCLAVGDSCVFQVRGKALLAAFPLSSSASFTRRPSLVRTGSGILGQPAVTATRGSWRRGDVFLLATDALAQWILRDVESGGRRWLALPEQTVAGFAGLVQASRAARVMENDDTALISVRAG